MIRPGRIAACIALASHGLFLGCSSVREIPVSESLGSEEPVLAVVYPSGKVVEFDDRGGRINTYRGTIDGTTIHGEVVSIPLDDTLHVRTHRTGTKKTVFWTVLGMAAVVGVVAALLSGSSYTFP